MVPPTARVEIENATLVSAAGTVTLGGTVIGSALSNETTAPPAGAGPVSVTVPVTELPPTTLDALNVSEASATAGAVTVSVADCGLPPPFIKVAVMVAVPAATAVTVNVPVDAPL
jgi:hypothetical protein